MIESPSERDLPEIRSLLERLQLPLAGVNDHSQTMVVAIGERLFMVFFTRGPVPHS
jgi:hypothetical protein